MTQFTQIVIFITFVILLQFAVAANQFKKARVVELTDGDTLKVLDLENHLWNIRLAEIDTPEKGQPWGKQAKQALAAKIFGKEVQIIITGKDRYGRWIGRIYLAGRDINQEMVREGHAWVYRKYLKDRTLLDDESYARYSGLGLWSLPKSLRTPPWEWRRTGKKRGPKEAGPR